MLCSNQLSYIAIFGLIKVITGQDRPFGGTSTKGGDFPVLWSYCQYLQGRRFLLEVKKRPKIQNVAPACFWQGSNFENNGSLPEASRDDGFLYDRDNVYLTH